MSNTPETDVLRISRKHASEIRRIALERGITTHQAHDIYLDEFLALNQQPKEQPVNGTQTITQANPATQNLPPSPAVDSPIAPIPNQTPAALPMVGAEFLRIGIELGAKLADLESRDSAQEASIKALAAGFSNHLDQHDQGQVDPQETRDLIMEVLAQSNLRGQAIEAVKELWSALPTSKAKPQLPAAQSEPIGAA